MLTLKNDKAVFASVVSENQFIAFWENIVDGTLDVQPFSNVLVKYFEQLILPASHSSPNFLIAFTFWDNDPETRRANLVGGYGFDYRLPKYPKRQVYGQGIVGNLLSEYERGSKQTPYVSCDCANDPYLVAAETVVEVFKFRSVIAFPIIVRKKLIGILKLYCNVQLDQSVKNNKRRLKLEGNRLSFLVSLAETQFGSTIRRKLAENFQYLDIRLPEAGQDEPTWLLKRIVSDSLEEAIRMIGAVEGKVYLDGTLFAKTESTTEDEVLEPDVQHNTIVDQVSFRLSMPNTLERQSIGYMEIKNKKDDTYFSRLDRNMLDVVAQAFSKYLSMYLAMSDETKAYHAKLDRQKHLLETSKSISLKLVRTATEEQTVLALLESIKTNFSFAALVFLRADKNKLVPYLSVPPYITSRLRSVDFDLELPPACVLQHKADWTINDCPECRLCKGLTVIAGLRKTYINSPDVTLPPYKNLHADFGVVKARGEFIIPIVAQDTLYGVLDMYRLESKPIEETESYFLQSICNAAAMSFHNRRLFDVLAKIEAEENRGEMAREVVHTVSPITSSMMIYFRLLEKSVNSVGSGSMDRIQLKAEAAHMKERLDNLREALRQQQNLIQRYGSASRSSDVVVEELNLNTIIEDVIEINSHKASGKRINLKNSVSGKRRTIRAIPMDVYLILWNLVNNSIKFTRGNKPTTILITERYDDHAVSVIVRDEGVGISDEDRPHIWNLGFSTIAPGEKDPTSGVGLATVKDLVMMIEKADIQVRSKLNSWTEFTLTIAQ